MTIIDKGNSNIALIIKSHVNYYEKKKKNHSQKTIMKNVISLKLLFQTIIAEFLFLFVNENKNVPSSNPKPLKKVKMKISGACMFIVSN